MNILQLLNISNFLGANTRVVLNIWKANDHIVINNCPYTHPECSVMCFKFWCKDFNLLQESSECSNLHTWLRWREAQARVPWFGSQPTFIQVIQMVHLVTFKIDVMAFFNKIWGNNGISISLYLIGEHIIDLFITETVRI